MSEKKEPIPMFKAGRALQSLRHSGYDLPTALGEVIDNSLEADANRIQVVMEETVDKRKKKHITRIIIIDDGKGMSDNVLHNYLQIGFSTRYMSTQTIGKFGVGAKLAALNFARRVDAYSRTLGGEPWLHVYFDMDEALEMEANGGDVLIAPPSLDPVPAEIEGKLPKGSGTMVIWSRIDKLEEGRHAPDAKALQQDVAKELSRIFRQFIHDGRKLIVEGVELLPHDPTYMMDRTFADKELSKRMLADKENPPDDPTKDHFPPSLVLLDHEQILNSKVQVTVTVYPQEVVRKRYKGGDELAKKLRVPENMGCISFMRLNREVSYTNVPRMLPGGVLDLDRFIGIEVSFKPELDEFFGIRNVKRGVEPDGEVRQAVRQLLEKFIPQARKQIESIWGDTARKEGAHKGDLAPIEEAVKDANQTMPQSRVESPPDDDTDRRLDELATDVVGDDEEKKEKYLDRIKELPFVVENVNFPGTNFLDVQHLGKQTIIRLNTRHRFYRDMWEPLLALSKRDPTEVTGEESVKAARRSVEALSLLLISYAKAETMNANPEEQYGDLRAYWGQFLDSLLFKVKDVI